MKRAVFLPLYVAGLCAPTCGRARQPSRDSLFTSTREVTCITPAPDGGLWVATSGGILYRNPAGGWRKFTRLEGLPSNETRKIDWNGGHVRAHFPRATAEWDGEIWLALPVESELEPIPICSANWNGLECKGALEGLVLRETKGDRVIPLPPSRATHISALLPRGSVLWAAAFGEGILAFDGRSWSPVDIDIPESAKEITALAETGVSLWVGTRREGIWEYAGGRWTQHLQRDEPAFHNAQALCRFQGSLYVSTMDDGLSVYGSDGWSRVRNSAISSNAPRQMVAHNNVLYVRHGSGKVDSFDGMEWERDIFRALPRKEVSSLAADESRLYAGQWGGWSEMTGAIWNHHLNHSELQGIQVTALLPDGDRLWIGTQGRGLLLFMRSAGAFRRFTESDGLPDDWITVLARSGDRVIAGTFVGGIASWDGAKWTPTLDGRSVTALEPDGNGGLFIATRNGTLHQFRDGTIKGINTEHAWLDSEDQCLCADPNGVWIGARTGISFVRTSG